MYLNVLVPFDSGPWKMACCDSSIHFLRSTKSFTVAPFAPRSLGSKTRCPPRSCPKIPSPGGCMTSWTKSSSGIWASPFKSSSNKKKRAACWENRKTLNHKNVIFMNSVTMCILSNPGPYRTFLTGVHSSKLDPKHPSVSPFCTKSWCFRVHAQWEKCCHNCT